LLGGNDGSIAPNPASKQQPRYRLELVPMPHCLDPHRAMRWLLKYAGRTCALRCVSIEPIPYDPEAQP